MKKSLHPPPGFALFFLLIWLPILSGMVLFTGHLVLQLSHRAQLRYRCLQRSLEIQRELSVHTDDPAAFNLQSRRSANTLLFHLKEISPDIRLRLHPEIRTGTGLRNETRLVYELNLPSGNSIRCGARRDGRDTWKYRIIYENVTGKY